VAPDLLGKLLVTGDGRVVRLVEVEAYAGPDDPGSHAYRGETPRNRTMWGPPGHLYVYFTYGMHWCANAVCGRDGVPVAVLLRAAEPIAGLELMRAARWRNQRVRRDRDLCRGPARLAQALGIDRSYDGADLVAGDLGLRLLDDGWTLPGPPAVTRRIGLSAGADLPWRWVVAGSPWASGPATQGVADPGPSGANGDGLASSRPNRRRPSEA
ncbi:MAG TPA: DNA-3-methyladenine glycosylase, partial [Acidimicrobiales bacterium]|nr:DNA-3-methyladenine glycosylase [Acidimicrobiales bacterium]